MPRRDRRHFSVHTPIGYVCAGVLTLVVIALAGYALTRQSNPGLAAEAAAYTPPALPAPATSAPAGTAPTGQTSVPSSGATSTAASTAAPTATPTATPRVVFLGDGYTASLDATDAAHGFPALVGAAEGWNVDVVACPDAGYVATGTCDASYTGLIPRIVADRPTIVVVTGGRNDTTQSQSSAQAADAFFARLHAALPTATVYAISPVWDSSDGPLALGVVQQSVKAAAAAHGATYVDIGEPLRGHPEDIASGVMPNDAGYAAIASAIESALRQ